MKHPAPRTRRALAAGGATLLLATAAVVGTAAPASAAVSVSNSGTQMTVNLTGTTTLTLACTSGNATANGITGTPAIACSALTKVTVNGDSAAQTVDGRQLDANAFTAKPSLTATMGAGIDTVTDTKRGDTISMGPGNDILYIEPNTVANNFDLGDDNDFVRYSGTDAVDTLIGTSTGSFVTLTQQVGGSSASSLIKYAERFEAATYGGNDTLDFGGITADNPITSVGLYAGDGDDTLIASQKTNTLDGGDGTNAFTGGDGTDNFFSNGNGDTIDPKGGNNAIYDQKSGRSGRSLTNSSGPKNWYYTLIDQADTVSRIRPGIAGSTLQTNSLGRPGQAFIPSAYKGIIAWNGQGSVRGTGLFDIVALANDRDVSVMGDNTDDDLLDVTIPTGAWTVSMANGDGWIYPAAPGYADIHATNIGEYRVHGPWTDKNKGFTHRATRDLMFRFATDQTINDTATALTNGTTTRPAVVKALMDTDEYRGLDVDRIFHRYLRRGSDPSGRTYWINSIKNGKALWRFRAQLFGSNEYFTKAGATNESYVNAVYKDVLGRLPDPSGRTYWTNKLNNGADRGSVALKFIDSSEFRRYIVDDQYLRFLDRKATTAEHTTWDTKITGTTTGEQDLIAALAAGNDYYNRT